MGNDQFDLTGKVAIIVGATKGMGAAIAEQFAASGARVAVNSRTAARASSLFLISAQQMPLLTVGFPDLGSAVVTVQSSMAA